MLNKLWYAKVSTYIMFKNWGIKQKVLVLTLIPSFAISLIMGIYFTSIRINELNQGVIDRGTASVSQLASLGQQGVFARDYNALRRLARKEVTKEISSIVFYNKSGTEIASAGKLSASISAQELQENEKVTVIKYPNSTVFIIPVTLPDILLEDDNSYSDLTDFSNLRSSIIGWVKIELELNITKAKAYKILLNGSLMVLLGLTISGLIAFRLGNSFTKPLISLTNAVAKIRQGKLDTRSNTKAKGELAILQSGINTMAQSLENAHQEMQYKIEKSTKDLRKSLETIEIQNLELKSARKKAEKLSNIKSEFIANMSHELRTPLNGMLGFINLLHKTRLDVEQLDFVHVIEKSANNLLRIINDILDFSKIEAGKLQISKSPMNLHECIEDAIMLLAPSAHEKYLEIVPFIYSDVPKMIVGDSLRIKQIITNLVGNAIKFTEAGSVVVRAMLEKATDEKIRICITVTDTGIGLSKKQKSAIFLAFNQANPNITRKFGGTGLGLVICKQLVEQMNGKIDVESNLNKGSTFWFTFESTLADDVEQNVEDVEQLQVLSGLKVILFEQHQMTRLSLLHLLNSWGIEVIEVDNINTLTSMVQKYNNNIHLALIGINNQNLNMNIIRNLAQKLQYKNINKIGVLINTTNHNIHRKILQQGINLCLAKPTYKKKLYKALCELFVPPNFYKEQKHPIHVATNSKEYNKLQVLTVDDNYANLKLVRAILENIGMQVTTASNGKAAIDVCHEQKFDIVFMDINMPMIDGIETTRVIKQKCIPNLQTPIIALSAFLLEETKEEIINCGMQDYLTKPVSENELKATIYKWTSQDIADSQGTSTDSYLESQFSSNSFESRFSPNMLRGSKHLKDGKFMNELGSFNDFNQNNFNNGDAGSCNFDQDVDRYKYKDYEDGNGMEDFSGSSYALNNISEDFSNKMVNTMATNVSTRNHVANDFSDFNDFDLLNQKKSLADVTTDVNANVNFNKQFNGNVSLRQKSTKNIILNSDQNLDWNLSIKLSAGNKSLAKDLLVMLLKSLPGEKEKINVAYKEKDFEKLRDLVHKLHGACCFCGVPKLKSILKNLEYQLSLPGKCDVNANIDKFNLEIDTIIAKEKLFLSELESC